MKCQRSELRGGKAHKAEMNREMRDWYRERGICVACGQTWAEPGYVRCAACYKKAVARMHRRDPDGKKHAAYVKQLRDERKAKGLCVDCGAKTDGLHVRCAACHERQLESSRIYKMKSA